MTINEAAPVIGRSEIEVEADPEIVWEVISGIDRWPQWNPAIQQASLAGPLAPGSQFRWKSGAAGITSTLITVDRPRVLSWKGKTMGINAVHVYRLDPHDGKTLVRTEESWEGTLVRLLRGRMQKTLDGALEPGLRALKAEAERRASS